MEDWLTIDIEVLIKPSRTGSSFKDGSLDGLKALIRGVESSRTARVIVLTTRNFESIPIDSLEPVPPEKRGALKVVTGEYKAQIGTLIGIDDKDGIVQLNNSSGEIKLIPFQLLASYQSN